MSLDVQETNLPGVLVATPRVFGDERGFFLQTFQLRQYEQLGIRGPFVQDNHSRSSRGVLRGLHYQLRHPQGKLISVIRGEILDVAVDIRRGSPSFGEWTGVRLSEQNHRQIFVPPGFAHGFCVLSETADIVYKCTEYYTPGDEYGVLWSDPALQVEWDVENPILSEKDRLARPLDQIPPEELPAWDDASVHKILAPSQG
jgi:dTDP-4-dehydrorhamnose 3,5-epimerase